MQTDNVKSALSGPVASVYATFHEDGTLDDQGTRNLLDAAIDAGSKTVLMTYGYGRPNLRDMAEPETPITIELNIPKPPGVMRRDSTG